MIRVVVAATPHARELEAVCDQPPSRMHVKWSL